MIVDVRDLGSEAFMTGLVSVFSLEAMLFGGCALLSLKYFAEREAVEPHSAIAFGLGAALLVAHAIHVIFLLLATSLA